VKFRRPAVYLIEDRHRGATNLVFTWEDPRQDGFKGDFIEGVTLDYDMDAVHSWPNGDARPEACLGRSSDNPKHYKVFKYASDLQAAGYQLVPGTALEFGSWSRYLKAGLNPPDPAQTDPVHYYDYLDELDDRYRHWRNTSPEPSVPVGGSRDDVAAWVAKTHFIADGSIREVWYLPQGAPPDEIRLLELSERYAGPEDVVEPIEFGMDVDGAPFRLVVADITPEKLEKLKQDPTRLPPGWSLEGTARWRRGA
jgi:hypothetical protein